MQVGKNSIMRAAAAIKPQEISHQTKKSAYVDIEISTIINANLHMPSQELMDFITTTALIPPVILCEKEKMFEVIWGEHIVCAAMHLGLKTITAAVYSLNLQDAKLLKKALKDNINAAKSIKPSPSISSDKLGINKQELPFYLL